MSDTVFLCLCGATYAVPDDITGTDKKLCGTRFYSAPITRLSRSFHDINKPKAIVFIQFVRFALGGQGVHFDR